MAARDKAKNATKQVKGTLEEKAGKVSGNAQLRVEGKADRTEGNLKQAGEKVKDALKK